MAVGSAQIPRLVALRRRPVYALRRGSAAARASRAVTGGGEDSVAANWKSSSSRSSECWEVIGGQRLQGELQVSGSKNAALVLMAASLLCSQPVLLQRVPGLADIRSMAAVLRSTGASVAVSATSSTLEIDPRWLTTTVPDPDAVESLRAGFLVLGPLLAREGRAEVALPGGCRIGARPVDLHLSGLQELGAKVTTQDGRVVASGKLHGAEIRLRFPSVGATECLVMAAVLTEGEVTVVRNAAMEPEIVALADFLNAAGAKVEGAGTPVISIKGVKALHGLEHLVIPDRIEAGTLAAAAACVAGSELLLGPVVPEHLAAPVAALRRMGCHVELLGGPQEGSMAVAAPAPGGGGLLRATNIETAPYPGFPTDLQPQFTTLLATAAGPSVVREQLFEARLRHAEALRRMGADISEDPLEPTGSVLCIRGRSSSRGCLVGCHVEATDLRCGAALVLAGLAADGVTTVHEPWHIDRGYDKLDEKLVSIGASVRRVPAV